MLSSHLFGWRRVLTWVVAACLCQLPANAEVVAESRWTGQWRKGDLAATAVDAQRVQRSVERIGDLEGVYGVLVVRGGELLLEDYFREGRIDKPHNLKSASKSVISALVGIAVDERLIDLDAPIDRYLAQARGLEGDKRSITVRDLLTMSSGLEPTSYESYSEWVEEPDWVAATLARPMVAEPGSLYQYSTANTHLLSAILTSATGMSTRDWAESRLFGPLGVAIKGWERDPKGIYIGGNNLSILPRDMARFGQLYLDGGRWGERQLISTQWVETSTGTGRRGLHRTYGTYGYLWFTDLVFEDAFMAVGFGGQYIYVSPAHDAVVVVTSTLESKGAAWTDELFRQLRNGVLAGLGISRRFYDRVGRPVGEPALDSLEAALRNGEAQLAELRRRSVDPASPDHELARTTTQVNLRDAPEKDSRRLALLGPGVLLEIHAHQGEWAKVEVDGEAGWVHGDYLVPEDPSWRPVAARLRRELEAFSETVTPLVGEVVAGSVSDSRPATPRGGGPAARSEPASTEALRADAVRAQALSAEVNELRSTTARLERSLRESEATVARMAAAQPTGMSPQDEQLLKADLDQLAEEVAGLLSDSEARELALKTAQRENVRLAALLEELGDRLENSEERALVAASVASENEARAETAEAAVATFEALAANSGSSAETARLEATAALENQLGERGRELARAEERAEALARELSQSQDEVARLGGQVDVLRASSQESLLGIEAELVAARQQVAAATAEGEALRGTQRDLEAALAALQSESDSTVSGLRKQVSELEGTLAANRDGQGRESDELSRQLAEERGSASRLASELENRDRVEVALRAEVATRDAQIAARNAEIAARNAEIAAADAEVTAAIAQFEAADSDNQRLREAIRSRDQSLAERDAEILRLASMNSEQEDSLGELEGRLAAARAAAGDRDSALASASAEERDQRAGFEARLGEQAGRIAALESELAASRLAVERAGGDQARLVEEARNETLKLRDETTRLETERTRLETERTRLETELAQLQVETDRLSAAAAEGERQLGGSSEEILQLESELADTNSALAAALERAEDLAEAASESAAASASVSASASELEAVAEQRSAEVAELQARNVSLAAGLAAREAAMASANERVATLEGRIEADAAAIAATRSREAEMETRLAAAQDALSEAHAEGVRLARDLDREQRLNQGLVEDLDEARSRVAEQGNEVGQASTALQQTEAALRESEARLTASAARQRELEAELEVARQVAQQAAQEAERERARETIVTVPDPTAEARTRSLEEDLETSQRSSVRLSEELESLRSSYESLQLTLEAERVSRAELARSLAQGSSSAGRPAVDDEVRAVELAQEVERMIRSWASAWSAQDVRRYLANYDETFLPEDGATRGDWAEGRSALILNPQSVRVDVASVEVQGLGPDRVRAQFRQRYSEDDRRVVTTKALELVRRAGLWRITREWAPE